MSPEQRCQWCNREAHEGRCPSYIGAVEDERDRLREANRGCTFQRDSARRERDAERAYGERLRAALDFFEGDGIIENLVGERDRLRAALEQIRDEVEPEPLDDTDREVLRLVSVALSEEEAPNG